MLTSLIVLSSPVRLVILLIISLYAECRDAFETVHYDATDAPGRRLPLIATARASILSLVSPQLRFTVKGTDASFVKSGIDIQEDQLKADGLAPTKSNFGIESTALEGTLYTADAPPKKIPTHRGVYKNWFINVAEAIQRNDPTHLLVTPEQAARTIEIIEIATTSSIEGRTILL